MDGHTQEPRSPGAVFARVGSDDVVTQTGVEGLGSSSLMSDGER